MARALKIQKYGTAQGITINADGTVNTPAAAVGVDIGYPNFGSLTDPVFNAPVQTLSDPEYLGVVGGLSTAATSATNPIILPQVNIALADGSDTGAGNGRILRQKGAHKFLVAYVAATTAAGSFLVGQAYTVVSLGNTDWSAVGAGRDNVAVGDIFTATAAGSGSGTAYPVGVCVLQNTGTPTAGGMSVEYSVADSAAVYASYISNKWIRDWTGMTYTDYNDSNSGINIYSGENFYPVNFFTDEGNVTWSGAEIIASASAKNGSLQLAQVVKSTS